MKCTPLLDHSISFFPSHYLQFLEEPLRKLKLIPDHVIVTIFSNIKQIININEELKQNLQVMCDFY